MQGDESNARSSRCCSPMVLSKLTLIEIGIKKPTKWRLLPVPVLATI